MLLMVPMKQEPRAWVFHGYWLILDNTWLYLVILGNWEIPSTYPSVGSPTCWIPILAGSMLWNILDVPVRRNFPESMRSKLSPGNCRKQCLSLFRSDSPSTPFLHHLAQCCSAKFNAITRERHNAQLPNHRFSLNKRINLQKLFSVQNGWKIHFRWFSIDSGHSCSIRCSWLSIQHLPQSPFSSWFWYDFDGYLQSI